MKIAQLLGIGAKKLMEQGIQTSGIITEVKTCWWLKVNTKPVRSHALDGALFPHRVSYRYTVNGTEYTGARIIGPYAVCPKVGDEAKLWYNTARPEKSALEC